MSDISEILRDLNIPKQILDKLEAILKTLHINYLQSLKGK